MHTRKIVLAVVTLATLCPVLANATPERTSVKACASAFASSIGGSGSTPNYKLAYRGGFDSVLSSFYPTEYTFNLAAHDPKTGVAIARAVCSTNSRGAVIAISAVPLDAKSATLAAQF